VASQMVEEVTAHAQSDSLEDAREICADGTYFPNNLRILYYIILYYITLYYIVLHYIISYHISYIISYILYYISLH